MVTWISFAIGFIASPISTRLLLPAEKGKLDMFMGVYAALISSVCYLGLDQAFVRFYNEPPTGMNRKGLFTFSILVPLTFSILSSLGMLFFWRSISADIVGQEDWTIFLCLCVYSFCLITYRFLSLRFRMEKNVKLYTLQGVIFALITKIVYLLSFLRQPNGESAILLLTVLLGVFTLATVLLQRKQIRPQLLAQLNAPALRELSIFALPLVPLSVLSWINASVSSLVLKRLLGYEELGIYSSALGLASTINIVQTGFNTYWAPYVLENYRSDERERFFTVHRMMACLLTFFGLILTTLQAPLFLLLGKNYRSSVVFFPFLFLSPICYCLGETTDIGITISKKTYWTTLIFLVSALLNIALCVFLIPLMGMAGAAVASALSAIVTLLMRTVIGQRYYKVLTNYHFVYSTTGLMLAASVGNLMLNGLAKYAVLAVTLAAALLMYRNEIKTLYGTAQQLLRGVHKKLQKHE